MSEKTEDWMTAEPLLEWLVGPRTDAGMHIAEASGWRFAAYRDVAGQVRAFAAGLTARGLPAGTVVNLLVGEPDSFVVSFFGCLLAGAIPSPVMPRSGFRKATGYVEHISKIFTAAGPRLVVVGQDSAVFAEKALALAGLAEGAEVATAAEVARGGAPARAPQPVTSSPDRVALLQFTSGSSGDPKGVRVPWRALTANVLGIRERLGLSAADRFAGWLPFFHDMGLIGQILTSITTRMDLWIMTPEQFIRDPKRWLECFGRHGATMTMSPGFGYSYSARRVRSEALAGFDFSGWRVAALGAERIDPCGVHDFQQLVGPFGFDPGTLVDGYGLAEATLAVTGGRPGAGSLLARVDGAAVEAGSPVGARRDGVLGRDPGSAEHLVSCGRPLAGMSVRILDDAGVPVPEGCMGEITVSGASLADGYLLADRSEIDFEPSGHRTGDAGFLYAGELFVVGRIGDCIKVRGSMVFAEDLEAELESVTGVGHGHVAVLLGRSHGVDRAVALVEGSSPEAWHDRALATLRARTSVEFDCSARVGRPGAISRTSSGKPRRRVMWRSFVADELTGWTPAEPAAADAGVRA